jgi:hypothetical protein
MILNVNVDPKMLRETLCLAQSALNRMYLLPTNKSHSDRLQLLIDECDRHRPLGPDGKHGDRHTETCGCDDKPKGPIAKCRRMDIHGTHYWYMRVATGEPGSLPGCFKIKEELTYCPGCD